MCLSTPPQTQKSNGAATTCAGSAATDTSCAGISACSRLNTGSACSDDTSSGCSIKQRNTLGNLPTATSNTCAAADANLSKDLDIDDNLGYKEENAVYKEISRSPADGTQDDRDTSQEYTPRIRWPDLMAQSFLHFGGLYGFYLLFTARFYTFLWVVVTIWASGIGITAGVHRLWSHKSYTAALPLRILLVLLFTVTGQRDVYTWALDHRIHHKFSETDADPHNVKRGFFFAHVGWLFLTPHPKVVEKRQVIDMSDLQNDAVVMFQRKWFIPLFALCSIGVPVLVPWYFWHEQLWASFWINFNMRFCCTLNVAFFVNSVAHMWGRRPYDKNIRSVQSPIVSFLALGEGWHNYHHVFPWDYKTSEFGHYKLNVTTAFIDFCAKLGFATGRKSVSPDMVLRRAKKCGDGTRFLSDEYAHKDQVWGYGDRDLPSEDAAELSKMRD